MRIGTLLDGERTQAFRQDAEGTWLLPFGDLAELLACDDWRTLPGERIDPPSAADLGPLFANPAPVICVGLNYRQHALEMGKSEPTHPTLFAKFPGAIVGPRADIQMPHLEQSTQVDWEAELVIVVGETVKNPSPEEADRAILGYTVMNDVSVRDWQRRTEEWFQGKNFDGTTPVGPVIVTADEFDPAAGHRVQTIVGEEMLQDGSTDDLIFSPRELVAYIASFMTLRRGDMIATGTPAGVGSARKPPRFLQPGDELITRIDGIGELRNRCVLAERN